MTEAAGTWSPGPRPRREQAAAAAAAEPLERGDPARIGPYAVIARLGSGGMGTVFLAQAPDGRQVAVKVIKAELAADPEFRRRFADEVDAARRVAPFCTAQVLDADPHARRPYLVTEYIDGERLDRVVTARGPLPISALQGVAVGVASALTAIHGAGIVHRDLKPSNVLLSYSGPRVIDFGIARSVAAAEGYTRTGSVLGSAGWMAPEQVVGGRVGPAVDVFAWGLLVAWAGTGHHPYGDGPAYEVAYQVSTGHPDLEGVPAALRPLIAAALTRDPARRPTAERLLLAVLGDHRAPSTVAAVTEVMGGAGFGLAAAQDAHGAPGGSAAALAAGRKPMLAPTRVGPPTSLDQGQRDRPYRPRPEVAPAGRYPDRVGDREAYARAAREAAERPVGPPYTPPGYAPRPRPAPEPARPGGGKAGASRRRLRLPFKRLIVLALLVLLLMSSAGRIRAAINHETDTLWNNAWNSVRNSVQHQVVDKVRQQVHRVGHG